MEPKTIDEILEQEIKNELEVEAGKLTWEVEKALLQAGVDYFNGIRRENGQNIHVTQIMSILRAAYVGALLPSRKEAAAQKILAAARKPERRAKRDDI